MRHLIEHGIALVTETDGEVVAFGAALDTGVARHLSDLFVRPDLLGRGIGRPLLGAAFGGSASHDVRLGRPARGRSLRPSWDDAALAVTDEPP